MIWFEERDKIILNRISEFTSNYWMADRAVWGLELAFVLELVQLFKETENSVLDVRTRLRRLSTVGCLRTLLKLLCLVCQTTAPARFGRN